MRARFHNGAHPPKARRLAYMSVATHIVPIGRAFAIGASLVYCVLGSAQTAKPAKSKAAASATAQAVSAAPAAVPFVNGHRIAPKPSWVVDVDAPIKAPASHSAPSYRLLLSD